jgi:hypothetical protein
VGDFNEIVTSNEKRGTTARSLSQMEAFQATLEDSQLCDLGFRGPKYTWNNGREVSDFIQEGFDRGLLIKPGWRRLEVEKWLF